MADIYEFIDKQANMDVSYKYHYSSSKQQAPSSAVGSSSYYSTNSHQQNYTEQSYYDNIPKETTCQKSSSLTLENLSKIKLAEPSRMPLARYCNEIESNHAAKPIRKQPSQLSIRTKRSHRPKKDTVLESPRLLAFPYHNDSSFLPTAEHDYPGCNNSSVHTDTSSSLRSHSIAGTSIRNGYKSPSLYTSNSRIFQRKIMSPSRSVSVPPSIIQCTVKSEEDDMSLSQTASVSQPSFSRRSSFTTSANASNDKYRLARKFKVHFSKVRLNSSGIHEKSRLFSSNSTLSVSTISSLKNAKGNRNRNDCLEDVAKYFSVNSNDKNMNCSWFEKLWKFVKPSMYIKKRGTGSRAVNSSDRPADSSIVWYNKFQADSATPVVAA